MPSDSNGNYALPAGYLAVGGDTILPSQHNPPLEDIMAGLTARLMRSGAGGMTGPLKLADGAVATPSLTFGTATTTGIYKTTAGWGVSIGGTLVAEFGAGGLLSGVQTVAIADRAVTYPKMQAPSNSSLLLGSSNAGSVAISAAANNGSGLIRLTTTAHSYTTGQKKTVNGVLGTTEANGRWTITVIDSTHIDLQGSTFTNAYTSGGTIGQGVTEIALGGGLSMSNDTLSSTIDPSQVPRFLTGLELSVIAASSTVTIGPGGANDRNAGGLMALSANLRKNTASWAVGDNNGGLDSGSIAINTWYHVFLIKRPDTGVVDALISTSATSPTLPTNYTLFRRIGSMKTDGANNWTRFYQIGDEFFWDQVTTTDVAVSATPSGLQTVNVPPGVSVMAHCAVTLRSTSTGANLNVFSGLTNTQTAAGANVILTNVVVNLDHSASVSAMTSTSRQIQVSSNGTGSITWSITATGWNDPRGK